MRFYHSLVLVENTQRFWSSFSVHRQAKRNKRNAIYAYRNNDARSGIIVAVEKQ